jgi:hypothetical protein
MVTHGGHTPQAILFALALVLAACGDGAPTRFGEIDQARVLAADSQPEDWLTSGRDAGKTHFSPLRQVNQATVGRLGFAWAYETGTNRVLEATPIVVDGVMYASGPMGRVWALDARNGREIWRFDPMVDGQVNRRACCDQANRGVAVWKGRVYVASLDGVLYALSAETGVVQWQTDTIYDRRRGYTVTGAPEIAGNAVVIGSAGDELDVRGYLTAYDLDTGAQKWRFFTIPGDPAKGPDGAASDSAMEIAARTWSPNSRWDIGGGGAPWDALHYDPETGLLFVGTGNGGPYSRLPRDPSGGDDLFLLDTALDPIPVASSVPPADARRSMGHDGDSADGLRRADHGREEPPRTPARAEERLLLHLRSARRNVARSGQVRASELGQVDRPAIRAAYRRHRGRRLFLCAETGRTGHVRRT